jgi:hypothetical protein
MVDYRKIWEEHFGMIPCDEEGRTYEIHHKDGNRENNDVLNLSCISIKDHYKIHYDQGDFGACVLIAKRMNLPKNSISSIQTGVKRPGIGGVKKGNVPWNKGISGYTLSLTEAGKQKKISIIKEWARITDKDAAEIRKDFVSIEIESPEIGTISKNGRVITRKFVFCKLYAEKYQVSYQYIYQIIIGKSKIVQI